MKQTMFTTKSSRVMVIVAVAILASASFSGSDTTSQARASDRCSVATLHGVYADHFQGLSILGVVQNPQPITKFSPFEANGVSYYDGTGHVVATGTAANGGLPAGPYRLTGTYRVNPDCTGSTNAGPNNLFNFVILRGAQEVNIMETDGTIAVWTETKM
jgi:hypothetical protein